MARGGGVIGTGVDQRLTSFPLQYTGFGKVRQGNRWMGWGFMLPSSYLAVLPISPFLATLTVSPSAKCFAGRLLYGSLCGVVRCHDPDKKISQASNRNTGVCLPVSALPNS